MKKLMENIQKWPNFKRVLDPKLQMGVLTICLLVIIAFSIGNTVQLNTVLLDSTENYVEDVAYQLTNEINAKLELAMKCCFLQCPFILMTISTKFCLGYATKVQCRT